MVEARDSRVLSRESELARLKEFVAGQGDSACMVLVGDPGMGKTTLWDEGVVLARKTGATVLWTRASAAETSLSFAALHDLLDGIDRDVLEQLPVPQLHAIEVAVRRVAPDEIPPDPLATYAGFLGAVRLLAAKQPVLIAVDDSQWIDPSSEDVLTFAARRQTSQPIRFLLSRRTDRVSAFERGLRHVGIEHLELSGLSLGAIGQLLSTRLGLALPRHTMRQLHTTAQGNPLVALELGRLLAERDPLDAGDELPFPVLDDNVFGTRFESLPPAERRALLAVALSAGLSRSNLQSLVDPAAVEDGLASGLLVVERGQVRPSHPLLAAAARHHASTQELLALHRDLAVAVDEPLLRAHHVAAATSEPDADVAETVFVAARLASQRGAADDAEELARQALRLTPLAASERAERIFTLARFQLAIGDTRSARSLLSSRMQELPAGRARVRSHVLLGVASDAQDELLHLERAERELDETEDDPELRAEVLARKAIVFAVVMLRRIDEAEVWARRAVDLARQCGPDAEARALVALAWTLALQGKPVIEPDAHPLVPFSGWVPHDLTIDRPKGVRAAFRGEVEAARRIFDGVLDQAELSGQFGAVAIIRIQICELELRRGNALDAMTPLEDLEHSGQYPEMGIIRDRLRAVLGALRGEPAETLRWAAPIIQGRRGDRHSEWERIEAKRALGISALYEGDPGRAAELLGQIWDVAQSEHIDDPGAFPVAGDLVEALIQLGDADSAHAVTERLFELSNAQEHPWGLIMAKRSDALLRLQHEYTDEAVTAFEEAGAAFEDLRLDFDACRTYLLLGRMQRRFKKSGAARRSLERAAIGFDALGCTGWADQARAEMARVGGRRAATEDRLTPSEERVAALAASGLSNKEIARQLLVSVYTVEEHLSHAYAKLGIRSRSQLAAHLGDRG